MAKQPPGTYKRSSSLSEIDDYEDDIIYDVISSDEENDKETTLARTGSLPSCSRVKVAPKPYGKPLPNLPRELPNTKHSLIPVEGFGRRELELSELVNESKVKLPVVVEIAVGNYGDEERCTFANGERYLFCYKTETNYVLCGNSEGGNFSIPVISRYEVALVNFEHEFANKTCVSVDNIIDMKQQPRRILANSYFEINGVRIAKGQILEIVKHEPWETGHRTILKVQTISGEEISLPRTLKQNFSCSIKTKSEPLPNAIEACMFPQRVVLTDTASSHVIRKQMCTLIKCFVKKSFLARIYTDQFSSIPTEDSLIEVPVDMNLTVKVIGKPSDTSLINEILKNQSSKKSTNEIKAKALAKSPPPKLEKPLMRSKSTTELRTKVTKRTTQIPESGNNNGPSTPQPERKPFFPPTGKKIFTSPPENKIFTSPPENKIYSSPPENKIYSSPPQKKPLVTPFERTSIQKPLKTSLSAAFLAGKEQKSPDIAKKVKPVETCNKKQHNQLESDIKILEETNRNLEAKLAEENKQTAKLEKRIASLEKSLEEANATISSNDSAIRNILLSKRALPCLPSNAGSAPTSPLLQRKAELSSALWDQPMVPPPTPLRPNKEQPEPHYRQPRSLLSCPTGVETVTDMRAVLQKINLGQYEDRFLKEGINMEILGSLNEDILEKDLKINNALHRKKLMKLAEKVKNNEDISNFYVDPQIILKINREKDMIYEMLD